MTILTEGISREEMKEAKIKRELSEQAEMVVQYGLKYLFEEFHHGPSNILTSIKNANYLLNNKDLDIFQRQKKLGAFVETVLSAGKGNGAENPPFNKLCYELVELVAKKGFPKSGESKVETAFERVAEIILAYKFKKKCAPKTVRNAYEKYPKTS